jgi:predicted ATPase/class 3 adenylate cyclase
MTTQEIESLEQAIRAWEAQRAVLGDAVVNAGLAPMQERLEALRRQNTAGQQRKLVSVLFADISGFTLMSEVTDAEDVTEATNALWQLLDKIILEHGGIIDKHMGDAVMALWGMHNAREDDAERAVRAALAMQQATQSSNLQINGAPVQVRIGIHTGVVFLSEVGITNEYTAMGDTVNTCNRLQHLSPVGGVIISHDTYLHVRGNFDVTPLQAVHIEGKNEPLQAYLVQAAKKRSFRMSSRGFADVPTHMVGRDADLKTLQEAVMGLLENKKCRMVTILGEAGIGKSRLLFELENWVEFHPARFRYFKGRSSPEMQNQPYALVRDLLATRFDIQESDPVSEVRQKMEQGIADGGIPSVSLSDQATGESAAQNMESDLVMRAHFIGQLLGYNFSDSPYLNQAMDAQQLRDRALFYLKEFFRANAETQPTLILLEDIHWADSRSLTVIQDLARALSTHPLLIVSLTRPSLLENQPLWEDNPPFHTHLALAPLSENDSHQLVTQLLRKADQVPSTLRELIVSSAEGNPYYVEELIKMLIDDGVIIKNGENWHIESSRLLKLRVPSTLAGILQSRLDSLLPQERVILQQASVIGRVFWDSALSYLRGAAPAANPENLNEILASLCHRELIFQRRVSAFSGTQEYIFKHALLRDVTYESVLKRERRGYHALVAEWLIANSGERSGELTGVIADHLELAGQAELAAQYLYQAGCLAAQQFANAEAIQYLGRALHLMPPTPTEERYATLLTRESVYDLQGMRAEQTQDLTELQSLAASIPDDKIASRKATVALRWSNYAEVTGNYSLAATSAQTAVEQARLVQDAAREAQGVLLWGRALWRHGNLDEAMARNQQALALAQEHGFKAVQAQAWRTIGAIAFHQGNYSNVMGPYEQALALYQELGDRRGIGSSLNNLGDIARQQGEYSRAKDYFEQAVQNSRETGERWSEAVSICNLSLVFHNLGNQNAACEYAKQCLQLARSIGYRSMEAAAHTNLAHATTALGDLTEAARLYQLSVVLHQEIDETATGIEARAGLARVYLAQGNLTQAREQVDVILNYLADNSLNGTDEPFRIYLSCFQVLRACDAPRAAQVLDTAHHLLQEQAARISDETLRRSFLQNVAAHAEIVNEWERQQAGQFP